MTRPKKCRRIASIPGITYFKPAGIPLRFLEEVQLTLEEAEAIRLKDIEELEQEQCATQMNVSRPTFQRILSSARKKTADALLNGKAIRIEGGNYEISDNPRCCQNQCRQQNILHEGETSTMKIAVVTDDETTVCQHFGRAQYYMVFNIEDGKITGKEKRAKMGHQHFAGHDSGHEGHGGPHGYDAASQSRHAGMAEAIKDCQVLIAGGMGMGAYDSMKSYKIEPIVTDIAGVEEAVKLYAEGKLTNLRGRLH
jgi:predicted DNA-binding protein (UPF0251 family)/predicted Fe-Mo cluster-binding NifX family protein